MALTCKSRTSGLRCCAILRTLIYIMYLSLGYVITLSFHPSSSALDSLLFVIVTITTVGYGNVIPNTDLAKCLLAGYVVLGTAFSFTFGNPLQDFVTMVGDKLEKRISHLFKTKSDRTKMKFKFFFAVAWIVFVLGIGTAGIMLFDAKEMSHKVVNATYFSVVAAYTIGYGDFHFSATGGKWFAFFWLSLGTTVVGSASSYLCGHRRWTCLICKWKNKSVMKVKTRIGPWKKLFEKGNLVEVNPSLRKHFHKHTDAETSLKFLSAILMSRIYECDFAQIRDLQVATECSGALLDDVTILLKREDCSDNLTLSYKWRGTYNFIVNVPTEMKGKGYTCAFQKQALVVAHEAKRLRSPDVPSPCFVMTPNEVVGTELFKKIAESKALMPFEEGFQSCEVRAKKLARTLGMTFVPPSDHTDIITGYGTIGMEIINEMVVAGTIGDLHAIFIPIGDGNLIAGIAAYVKRVAPKVKVFGVEERTKSIMAWSFHKGKRVLLENQYGEVVVEAIGEECFSICAELVDGIIIVDNEAMSAAKERIMRDTSKEVGALCIAGVQCYRTKYMEEVRTKTIVAVIEE